MRPVAIATLSDSAPPFMGMRTSREQAAEASRRGGPGAAAGPACAGALGVGFEREDDVEGGGFLDAAEFEGADHGVFLAVEAKGDEGVGDADAAEIERVGAALGVGVEEGRREGFGGQEEKGAKRRKRGAELAANAGRIANAVSRRRGGRAGRAGPSRRDAKRAERVSHLVDQTRNLAR